MARLESGPTSGSESDTPRASSVLLCRFFFFFFFYAVHAVETAGEDEEQEQQRRHSAAHFFLENDVFYDSYSAPRTDLLRNRNLL